MGRQPSKKGTKSKTKKQTQKPAKKAVKKSVGKKHLPKKSKKRRSRKKWLFITALGIILLIGTGIVLLLTNLNYLVKTAIEKYGSQATQTAVRVKGVDIRLKDGAGNIEGLTVANPEGFETPHDFSLGEIGVDINLKSLTGDEIVIDEILIRASRIFVEVNADNKNNLYELKKNLPTGSKSSSKADKKNDGKETRLFIRRIRFYEGQIDAKVIPLDKEYHIKMPSIEMWNLRGTPGQIAAQVINRVTNQALSEIRKKGIGKAMDKLGGSVKSQLEIQKKKAKDKVKDLLLR